MRRAAAWLLAAGIGVAGAGLACAQEQAVSAERGAVPNVARAFEKISSTGRLLKFSRGALDVPLGGHFQGIQARFDTTAQGAMVFLSHDSDTIAYLAIVEFPSSVLAEGRIVEIHPFPSDGKSPPLRHAGGIQLLGNVLVVGLEDNQQKTRSEVQFWNVSRPTQPSQLSHLTIRRAGAPKDKTAGAVGIVERERDHLLAVANWDSRAIDVYLSNGKSLIDSDCRFDFHARWLADTANKDDWRPDQVFGAYQSINLLPDAQGKIFLLGCETTTGGKDVVDLFAIDVSQEPRKLLQKLARKSITLEDENHFRYAGGICVEGERLLVLSSPRGFSRETTLNIIGQAP